MVDREQTVSRRS